MYCALALGVAPAPYSSHFDLIYRFRARAYSEGHHSLAPRQENGVNTIIDARRAHALWFITRYTQYSGRCEVYIAIAGRWLWAVNEIR